MKKAAKVVNQCSQTKGLIKALFAVKLAAAKVVK